MHVEPVGLHEVDDEAVVDAAILNKPAFALPSFPGTLIAFANAFSVSCHGL